MDQIAELLQSDEGKALIQQQLQMIDARQAAAASANTAAVASPVAPVADIGNRETLSFKQYCIHSQYDCPEVQWHF